MCGLDSVPDSKRALAMRMEEPYTVCMSSAMYNKLGGKSYFERASEVLPAEKILLFHSAIRFLDLCMTRPLLSMKIRSFYSPLPQTQPISRKSHRLLNLRNRPARVQPLWTRPRAVQNRVAPVQTHAVVQRLFPLRLVLVARVGEPAV